MSKIVYMTETKQTNGVVVQRVVEDANVSQAIRHVAKDTIRAKVMSPKEVVDWMRADGKVETANGPEEIPLTPEQLRELSRAPGVKITASLEDGASSAPVAGLPTGDR